MPPHPTADYVGGFVGYLKHVIFGDKVDVFEFDTFYNFFEFIDGIAWELSFHGAPAKCEIRR